MNGVVLDGASGHTPVLCRQALELLAIKPGETVVDLTVGLGGHAIRLAEAVGPTGLLVGLDLDPTNFGVVRERLSTVECRVELLQSNFAQLQDALASIGVGQVDVLFADLGVSSVQLNSPERGFSFSQEGPLDMRLDPDQAVTASELVNRLKERELADLIYRNSQEPCSRRIAKKICEVRRSGRITTTARLADVVCAALGVEPGSHRAKIHPATRTFMALRIAVNDELRNLDSLLSTAPDVLKPGGRIGVISFHSLEDKPIKLDFRKRKNENTYRVMTNKPVVADEDERRDNPRSRSAKLRVALRLGPQAS